MDFLTDLLLVRGTMKRTGEREMIMDVKGI